MKSSRNRSRSKGNRNRSGSVGNVVNRVFDSSGPEGKVRGTPQQIIDKYNQLTRDAQLSGDRVAAENFQQHAEHYLRMLAEAQREQDARRDQQNQNQPSGGQGGQGGQQGNNNQGGGQQGGGNQGDAQNADQQQQPRNTPPRNRRDSDQQPNAGAQAASDAPEKSFDAVIDGDTQGDNRLVETPENAPKPKRPRTRRPRKSDDTAQSDPASDNAASDQGKSDGKSDAKPGGSDTPPQEAAE